MEKTPIQMEKTLIVPSPPLIKLSLPLIVAFSFKQRKPLQMEPTFLQQKCNQTVSKRNSLGKMLSPPPTFQFPHHIQGKIISGFSLSPLSAVSTFQSKSIFLNFSRKQVPNQRHRDPISSLLLKRQKQIPKQKTFPQTKQ